jgi:hypothetical protein
MSPTRATPQPPHVGVGADSVTDVLPASHAIPPAAPVAYQLTHNERSNTNLDATALRRSIVAIRPCHFILSEGFVCYGGANRGGGLMSRELPPSIRCCCCCCRWCASLNFFCCVCVCVVCCVLCVCVCVCVCVRVIPPTLTWHRSGLYMGMKSLPSVEPRAPFSGFSVPQGAANTIQ